MKINLKHFGKMSFEAVADSGHRVVMSGAPEVGGENHGGRPMEMVLIGLGGCSGIDVLSILRKSRAPVSAFAIEIEAERAESVPRVFTRIHVRYIVSGKNLSRPKVARAIALSMDKYCSVTRMLAASVAITHEFEIVECDDAPDVAPATEPGGGHKA